MKKYLFTDGTNVIREVQSEEELQTLIQSSAELDKIRIWIFNTNEWLTHAEFCKQKFGRVTALKNDSGREDPPKKSPVSQKPVGPLRISRVLILLIAAVAIFLVYNFTRIKWRNIPALEVVAQRPVNVPIMDVDSLIREIEFARNQKLDKITATNLRIRNTWPDRIQLKLKSDRQAANGDIKFYNVSLFVDNSTGYNVDEVIVELNSWKNNEVASKDTFQFNSIGYAQPSTQAIPGEYRGDSLSVSFLSLRSKAFNFCYSAEKESNYGNLNDRWFCRE